MNSLWTGTTAFRIDYRRLLVNTLVLCCARRAMGNIHFVTDRHGREIAETLGWKLDSVSIALEAMPASLRHIWAAGKLYASALQGERFLQIDGDVILFRPISPEGRIFTQSVDNPEFYRNPRIRALMVIAGLEPDAPAYNVGVIGGDPRFLCRFALAAMDLCERNFLDFRDDGTNCSMIAEQVFISDFCHHREIDVSTLFREMPTRDEARKLGYVHLQGTSKSDERQVAAVKNRLKRDFPEQYQRFKRGIGELELALPDDYLPRSWTH